MLYGTDDQLRKSLAPFAPLKIPSKGDSLAFFGRILAVGTAGLAALGVALILFAYLLVKLWLSTSRDPVPIAGRLFTGEPDYLGNGHGLPATTSPGGDGRRRYWSADGDREGYEDAIARIKAMQRDRDAAAAHVQARRGMERRPQPRRVVRASLLASPAASIWPHVLGPSIRPGSHPRGARGKGKR